MTTLYPLPAPQHAACCTAAPVRHVLPPGARWRAWWPGVGTGRVLAADRYGTMDVAYLVQLDDGGDMRLAMPCQLRRACTQSAWAACTPTATRLHAPGQEQPTCTSA